MEYSHDPSEYIRGLQQLLISDKKKIGFLFGAGTSSAKKNESSLVVPNIANLTKRIEEKLKIERKEYCSVFEELKEELEGKYNIETILSNLEQKILIIGKGTLNSLDKDKLKELIKRFKELIKDEITVHKGKKEDDFRELIQTDFAKWLKLSDRKYGVEIFTTNYDYLFELGLEYHDVPYYDGFIGSYNPFFYSESIENMQFLSKETKLWKIHGSLGWHIEKSTKKIIRKENESEDLLIYPSELKYKDSKKQPYASLMDRLLKFLKEDDTVLITSGYSFGDEHINERITSALNSTTTSHLIVLFYDKYWDKSSKNYKYGLTKESALYQLASKNSKISVYGFESAIIGGKLGKWELKKEPTKDDLIELELYFDAFGDDSEQEMSVEKKGEEKWIGGEFYLPDFKNLVKFLSSMIFYSGEKNGK